MKRKIYLPIVLLLMICYVFSPLRGYADGSKDLYPSGVLGNRAFLVSADPAPQTGWPYLTEGVHYAYAKVGETVTAASSAQGIGNGRIILIAPDGTTYSSTVGSTAIGWIGNRTQELAGPIAGYTPFSQVVGPGQAGIWQIKFVAPRTAGSLSSSGVGGAANANWSGQLTNTNAIRAWDATVFDAANNPVPGRVYSNIMNMYISGSGYFGKVFVLTNDGYVYKVDNNGQNGIGFMYFVNNKGLTIGTGDDALPSYKSLNKVTDIPVKDPREPDGINSITHKIFYTMPDPGMPATSVLPGGSSTWLFTPKVIPTVSNMSIEGVEGTTGQVGHKGATIKFDANMTGSFRITISGPGIVTREIRGVASIGANSAFWDGKDGSGAYPAPGVSTITVAVQLQGAEVHFPFIDLENNPRGLIIEQLNNDGSVKSDIVYWDDSDITSTSTAPSSPTENGNDGSGISSNLNGHKWTSGYGDVKVMDTWAYILGDVLSVSAPIDFRLADLEVQSVAPATPVTAVTQGQTITYTVPVINNGPSDVAGAPFKFTTPPGLSIGNVSNVTFTTSCGTVNNAALDGAGNYTALLDMPNGCMITFSVTATASASLVCQPIPVEASIMRPNDVTDPDATNPDPSVLPTDPHVECLNGTATEACNNIKYNNTVTVAPLPPVSGGNKQSCEGTTLTATATVPAGSTVTWYDAATGGNVVATPEWSTPGTVTYYAATIHGSCSSIIRTPVTLTIIAAPLLLVTDPLPVCVPGTVYLPDAGITQGSEVGLMLAYYTNAAGTIPLATPTSVAVSGTYYIKATSPVTGCSIIKPVKVVLVNAPVVTVSASVCAGENGNITVTAPLGPDYTYSIGAGVYQASPVFDNVVPGTYQVRVASISSGCLSRITTVTVSSVPGTPVPVVTQPTCASPLGTIELPAYAGATYSMNGGLTFVGNNKFIDVAPGPYSMVVKSSLGCVSAPVPVIINAAPAAPASPGSGGDQVECANSPVQTLTATASVPGGETLTWYDAPSGGNVVASPILNTVGTVTYYAEAGSGSCKSAARTPVSLTMKPAMVLVVTDPASVCTGTPVDLTAAAITQGSDAGLVLSYYSDAGAGASLANPDAIGVAGTYYIMGSNTTTGCARILPVVVDIVDQPTANAGGDQTQLNDGAFTLGATTPTIGSGKWSVVAGTPLVAISDETDPGATISLSPNTSLTLRWTVTNGICEATDDVVLTYTLNADIVTVKTLKDGAKVNYAPGEDVVYTITVTNNGPSDAPDVNILDVAPAGTTIDSWTATVTSGAVTLTNTSGSGDLDEAIVMLPNGAVVTYEVTLNTASDLTNPLINTATVTTPTPDPDPTCTGCTTPPLPPVSKADIVTVKTLKDGAKVNYAPGEDVVYTITVTNNGPSDATDVNITDAAPTGTTIDSWTATVTSGTVTLPATSGSGDLNETIATFPNGAVVTYEVTVKTPSSLTGSLTNTAAVTTSTPDPDPTCTGCTTPPLPPVSKADIVTVKTLKDGAKINYAPGEDVVYTITVTNNGPSDATAVNIADAAPTGTAIDSWTATVTSGTVTLPNASGSGDLNETIAAFPNGAVVTYDVTVKTPSNLTGSLINTAAVTTPTPDPDPTCTGCTTPPLPPVSKADIATVKTLKDGAQINYAPGEDVVYTITVTNNGPSDATAVNIADAAPTGTTIDSWTATVTSGTVTLPNASGSGDLNETIATFPNGAVVTYEVTVKTPTSLTGSLINTATITTPTSDPDPSCTGCTTPPLPLVSKADIVTVKTLKDGAQVNYTPGEDVVYTITVTNNGPSNATAVNIADAAPTGTTIDSWTATVTSGTVTLPNASGTGDLNETIAMFPNGAVVTYEVTVKTPSSLTGSLINTTAVTTPTSDPDPTCTGCTTPPLPPLNKADIVTVKTLKDGAQINYAPGEDVVYTITVTNNGPSDATAVNIADAAPTGTTIDNWTATVTSGTVTLPNASGTGDLNETIAMFPNGAVVTYEVTVKTPSSLTGSLINTTAVTTPTSDPDPTCTGCTTPPLPPVSKADIVTVKTLKDGAQINYAPGEDVVYTITVTNNGPSDATAVNIADAAPTGTAIDSWTATVTSGTVTLPNASGSGDLNETIATFPNGAVVTYEVTVKTPASLTGSLINTAAVTTPTPDPDPTCTGCTTPPLPPVSKADIVTVKTLKDGAQVNYAPGEDVVYTITVTNNGPSDATAVNIADAAPTGTTIDSWTATVTSGTVTLPNASGSGDLNETIATFPNGAVVTYEVTVKTPASLTGSLINTAAVTTPTPDPDPTCTGCTTPPLPPVSKADIVTVKTLKDGAKINYAPGEDVVYTITVTNNGPSDATAVNIADAAPTGTTIDSWTAAVTGGTVTLPNASGSGDLNETIAVLPNGAVVTYEITVKTSSSLTGSLINIAAVTTPTPDPDPTCTGCTTPPLPPVSKADIVTVKTLKDGAQVNYAPGEDVVYTITVTNNGPSDATAVNIADAAPTGTTIDSWAATVTSGTVTLPNASGSGDLNETIATFPNGAVVTYEVTVKTPSGLTGSIINTATITTPTPDPDPTCTGCTTPPLPPVSKADIVTVKTLKDGAQVNYTPGEDVVYTITVTNNGPSDATAVNIADAAPTGTTIDSWTATVTSGTVTLPNASGTGDLNETIAMFPNGAVVIYEVTVKTPSSLTGSLINTAAVTTPTPDPDPTCTGCTTPPLPPVSKADIVTVKTLKDGAKINYAPGEDVVYTITVTNNGPGDATAVNIADAAPTGTTINSWTATVTSGTVTLPNASGTGDLNETIATFPNGAVVTYEVTVKTPASLTGSLINTATITTPTLDPDPTCTGCTTPPLPPVSKADIVTVKTLKDGAQVNYAPGEDVVYTITVTNNGPSDATNVNVSDVAPAGTTIGNWTATGTATLPNASGSGDLNETITTFPNGAVATYEVTVKTPSSLTGSLINTATVTTSTTDPDPTCAGCTTPPLPPVSKADIVTVKTLKDGAKVNYAPGENVVYTITVTNNGPSDATVVNIADAAPTGTTIDSWTATVTSGTVTLPNASGSGDLNETVAVFPNGAVVTYEVTVMTPASLTGSLINTATVTTPTPDPDPACTGCTTVPLPPATQADIVTVKTLKDNTQDTFIPGEDVIYTITVTNNGPSNASDVHIVDNAPAGTTISSWSSSVTKGAVTLPHTSGSGNLDETIAAFPNGAAVTYEVTVKTPVTFAGDLVNTTQVTSTTTDPVPACTGCTAPPVTALNIPPVADDNEISTKEGRQIVIQVLDNDSPGASGSPLVPSTLEIISQPAHGTITVNADGTIVYTPDIGFKGEDTFSYRIKDANGLWSNAAMVKIAVEENELQIPDVITPNGDGQNDKFVIKGLEKYQHSSLVIFNRWNNKVYERKEYQGEWDGNGLNAGTYFYTLKVQEANGQWHTFNGYIMLLR